VKDKKLGAPLGLNEACRTGVCPELIEHAFSNESLTAVHRNILGFQAAFNAGFDDYLKAAGGEDLAERIAGAIGLIRSLEARGESQAKRIAGMARGVWARRMTQS